MKAALIFVTFIIAGAGFVLWLGVHPKERRLGLSRWKQEKSEAVQGASRFPVTSSATQKNGQRSAGAISPGPSFTAMNAPGAKLSSTEERNLPAGAQQEAASEPQLPRVGAKLPDKLRPPGMPLVFREVDEAAVPLEPAQAAAAAGVQDIFADQMSTDAGDPLAEVYRDRWQHEQPVADQRLRAMIGAQAYARWQREAYIRSRKTTPGQP